MLYERHSSKKISQIRHVRWYLNVCSDVCARSEEALEPLYEVHAVSRLVGVLRVPQLLVGHLGYAVDAALLLPLLAHVDPGVGVGGGGRADVGVAVVHVGILTDPAHVVPQEVRPRLAAAHILVRVLNVEWKDDGALDLVLVVCWAADLLDDLPTVDLHDGRFAVRAEYQTGVSGLVYLGHVVTELSRACDVAIPRLILDLRTAKVRRGPIRI